MPKTKTRRKSNKGSTGYTQVSRSAATLSRDTSSSGQAAARRVPSGPTPMSLVMAAMVTLGCWGMAISFIFFSADPNRYLFGGMAVLMGLMWALSFSLRLRKLLQQR